MKKILMVLTAMMLCVTVAMLAPAQVMAAANGSGTQYVSEVKVGMGKTSEEAAKELPRRSPLISHIRVGSVMKVIVTPPDHRSISTSEIPYIIKSISPASLSDRARVLTRRPTTKISSRRMTDRSI